MIREKGIIIFCFVIINFSKVQSLALGQIGNSSPQYVELPEQANILLHETFRLGSEMQNDIWPGWTDAPFAVLLVAENHEFLVNHPNPTDDFSLLGYDTFIGDSMYVRERQFPPTLRATFPAVGGVPTIVIGMPDSSESPTQWVLTALHEHFHQWQMSRPGYYAAVNDLDLSGGDNTGQWMLNYPFPYDSAKVQQDIESLREQLVLALESLNKSDFPQKAEDYLAARKEFQEQMNPDDYRYYSFQLWQEGVARYVEYRIGKWAALNYNPSEAFRRLEGFEPFEKATRKIKERVMRQLSDMSLKEDRRTTFYPIGAAEAMLLDEVNSDWKKRYWEEKFYLGKLFYPQRVQVKIDPRIELMSIIQLLADYPLVSSYDMEYKQEVKTHYLSFGSHPAVSLFKELSARGFAFDAVPKFMLTLSEPPELKQMKPIPGEVIDRVGSLDSLELFIESLRDFSDKSDFMEFYQEHNNMFSAILDSTKHEAIMAVNIMENYTAHTIENGTVILGMLLHHGGFAARYGELPAMEVYALAGPVKSTEGMPDFGSSERIGRILWHEFSHTLVNALTNQHWSELEKYEALYGPIAESMEKQAYPDWEITVNEHIVRAITVRLLFLEFGQEAGENALQNELKRGFAYIEPLVDQLEEYEKNRESYATFADYYPFLIEVFENKFDQ